APRVAPPREAAVEIQQVGEATAHAGAEVPACAAEHDDAAPGHVLAAVVADALDHRLGAAVAHAEALARDALEVRLSPGRPVQHHVAGHDVLGRAEARGLGDAHPELA